MMPLMTAQKLLTWLCILRPDESTNEGMKRAFIAFTFTIVAILGFASVSSAIFVRKFALIDFEKSLFALCVCLGCACLVYVAIVTYCFKSKIASIFEKLSEIYDSYKDDISFRFLARANNTSERWWNFYYKQLLKVFWEFHVGASVVSVLVCQYKYGKFDKSRVYVPANVVLPFNQTTTIGYLGETSFSMLFAISYLILNGVVFLMFISICLHHQAFYEIFRQKVRKLNNPEVHNKMEVLCELIRFHETTRSWFSLSADVYNPIVFGQLVISAFITACCIFQQDQQSHNNIHFNACVFISGVILGLSVLFIFCYFGKLASISYEKMADCLYECNWHELPLDLQKYFIIMIANTQKSIFYRAFGVVNLNLETFTNFLNTIYSYYMIFKTLSELRDE